MALIREGRDPQQIRINRQWHVTVLVTRDRDGTIVSTVCGRTASTLRDDFVSVADSECPDCVTRRVVG